VPLPLLTRSCFDYVALGHVHRHQILCDAPPVVYPGSIERVDFSEENEEKGYVMVQLQKGRAEVDFCPLPARRFCTIKVDVSETENPQEKLLGAIAQSSIEEAVVRLVYHLQSDQIDQIDLPALHSALNTAHTYTIHPELVSQLARPRLPELGADRSLAPLDALQTYLSYQPELENLAGDMLRAAQSLLASEEWLPLVGTVAIDTEELRDVAENLNSSQLRLL